MTSNKPAKLLRHAAYFPVSDVERSMAFYIETLGFRCEYSAGSPLQFAICSRDDLAVMLRRIADTDLIVPIEKQGGSWDAFFWVDDAEALHAELTSKQADIVYGPLVQDSYQMLEFAVRDCDGHVLGFGETLAREAAKDDAESPRESPPTESKGSSSVQVPAPAKTLVSLLQDRETLVKEIADGVDLKRKLLALTGI